MDCIHCWLQLLQICACQASRGASASAHCHSLACVSDADCKHEAHMQLLECSVVLILCHASETSRKSTDAACQRWPEHRLVYQILQGLHQYAFTAKYRAEEEQLCNLPCSERRQHDMHDVMMFLRCTWTAKACLGWPL